MKKIGEGWQYSVYDLGNGKVLKRFHPWHKAYWAIFKTIFPFRDDSFWEIPNFIRGSKDKADASFQILKRRDIPRDWLGNPRFINRYDFEQDKVRPLHDIFEKSDTKDIRKIIDKFIEFNKKLFALGVIDKSFNITKNYGLSDTGEVILTDIGELFDDPVRVNHQRETRAWAAQYVAGCIRDEKGREYFIQEMDKNFGVQ